MSSFSDGPESRVLHRLLSALRSLGSIEQDVKLALSDASSLATKRSPIATSGRTPPTSWRWFLPLDEDDRLGSPSRLVVSSVSIEQAGAHEVLRVWTRGGLAGELTVAEGDGQVVAERLGLSERLTGAEPTRIAEDMTSGLRTAAEAVANELMDATERGEGGAVSIAQGRLLKALRELGWKP